ncbi:MAG: hypothetical protein OHK0046_26780 [Anaerolineae bacterium]
MRGQSGLLTVGVVLLVFAGFGVLLYSNARPVQPLVVIVPTQVEPTAQSNPWQDIFREGFGGGTPLPTIPIPDQPFVAPTIIPNSAPTLTPFGAAALLSDDLFTLQPPPVRATPTRIPPTPLQGAATNAPQIQAIQAQATIPWQPPPLLPPQNRDPLGRDHYYFTRPIDSDGYNFGLPYYTYGSRGQQLENPLRVHHGIDMPNPVGTTVRAANSGTVCFTSEDESGFQGSSSYGNVVVIEHDFGWEGQLIYTLYTHLQRPLVQIGDQVAMGDAIGLTGATGSATGSHLHFEVRMGPPGGDCGSNYGSSYNPVLWMVPYVGHGTVAGILLTENGNRLDNYNVTLREWSTGRSISTLTYIFDDAVDQVNPDPNWGENFVFGDVRAGLYEVIATYNGQRLSSGLITVEEGMTTFVELKPGTIATPQDVPASPETTAEAAP